MSFRSLNRLLRRADLSLRSTDKVSMRFLIRRRSRRPSSIARIQAAVTPRLEATNVVTPMTVGFIGLVPYEPARRNARIPELGARRVRKEDDFRRPGAVSDNADGFP